MANTPSTMLALGTPLPSFCLPDPHGRSWTSTELSGKAGLLVMFICNHCPFVIHIAAELARLGRDYPPRGLGVVAINANDIAAYPADRPELMAAESSRRGYTFPYVFDASQDVAKGFHAACTPDFFLFDGKGLLVYRGQLDGARPGNGVPVTGSDLRAAADAVISGTQVAAVQVPSIGCNIKWRQPQQS